jgi:uncharacterized membrane protein
MDFLNRPPASPVIPSTRCWFLSPLLSWWGGMWAYASTWLIAAGIVSALIAALFGFTDFLGEKRIRQLNVAWMHMVGNLVVVGLSVWNLLIHHRDGPIAVIPTGITLSAIVVVLLVINGWMGGHMIYRHGVAVWPLPDADHREP